jgi:hypothetical protein
MDIHWKKVHISIISCRPEKESTHLLHRAMQSPSSKQPRNESMNAALEPVVTMTLSAGMLTLYLSQ